MGRIHNGTAIPTISIKQMDIQTTDQPTMNLDSFLITTISGILGLIMTGIIYKSGLYITQIIWGDLFLVICKVIPAFFSGLAFYATNEKWVDRKWTAIKTFFKRKKK